VISPERRAEVLAQWLTPQRREDADSILIVLGELRAEFPEADNDTEISPLAQEITAWHTRQRKAEKSKKSSNGKTIQKRVKAVPTTVKPKGTETWYVIPSDPDYAVSNRLRVVRLTATNQNPGGALMTPRLRYFKGQFHAIYRLSRAGKKLDHNVAHLLSNAMRAGKKAARTQRKPSKPGVAIDPAMGGTKQYPPYEAKPA